jgi:hypothetical protein
MIMRLAGQICDGQGAINEDLAGVMGADSQVRAAWVLDGVTGINPTNLAPGETDASWFVKQVDTGLRRLLQEPAPLAVIMPALVDHLVASRRPDLPKDYDPPACCLLLVRELNGRWDAVRIGDSSLLARDKGGLFAYTEFPLQWLDRELKIKTAPLREMGHSQQEIVEKFRPMLMSSRQMRNKPGGYGILEADPACLDYVQYIAFEDPEDILLCTDGFYRLVETYELLSDEALLRKAAAGEIPDLLAHLRKLEKADADCRRYPRFKPQDDATAIALTCQNNAG